METNKELLQQAIEQVDGCMCVTQVEPEDAAAWQVVRAALAKQADAALVGEKPFGYMIVGAAGAIEFATKARHEAQEHINDACENGDVEGAGQWRAVPVHLNRPSNDHLWDQTLRERDGYHDVADRLAGAIAEYFGEDIGEHSSANCPWDEALRVIEEAPPLAQRAVSEAVPYGWILETGHGAKFSRTKPVCEIDLWKPVSLLNAPPAAPVTDVSWEDGFRNLLFALKVIAGAPKTCDAPVKAAQMFSTMPWVEALESLGVKQSPAVPVALSDDKIVAKFRNWLGLMGEREAILSYSKSLLRDVAATQPTDADKRDAERLDWLNKNFFSDEKDEWDRRQAPTGIKWKFFGTQKAQGDIRVVIDAAIAASAKEAK